MTNFQGSHFGNLLGFDELLSAVMGYGKDYNPANPTLKVPALEAKSAMAHKAITNINTIETAYRVTVEQRVMIYEPLGGLVTRIFNFIKSSGTSSVMINEVAIIFRKLKGARAGKKLPEKKEGENQQAPQQISVSQMSYDERLNNFDRLIRQVELIPQYNPNESDLLLTALREYWNAMDSANKRILKAANELSNARIARDLEFYAPESGLTEVGRIDKLYIKAVFGANSPQYRQIAGISFKNYKN